MYRLAVGSYQVKLSVIDFEGPLDLLLHLIRKNEINIYDIPIAFILREYLLYLRALQEIDVQLSSEFLVMAGKMMFIKSKMLLPSQWLDEDPNDPWFKQFEDPMDELTRQLENRARLLAIRETLDHLRMRELQGAYTYRRRGDPEEAFPPAPAAELGEMTLTDLLSYYERTISRSKELEPIEMHLETISIKSMIKELLGRLKRGVKTMFNALLGRKPTTQRIISSFLALLELCKEGKINMYQANHKSPIEVERI